MVISRIENSYVYSVGNKTYSVKIGTPLNAPNTPEFCNCLFINNDLAELSKLDDKIKDEQSKLFSHLLQLDKDEVYSAEADALATNLQTLQLQHAVKIRQLLDKTQEKLGVKLPLRLDRIGSNIVLIVTELPPNQPAVTTVSAVKSASQFNLVFGDLLAFARPLSSVRPSYKTSNECPVLSYNVNSNILSGLFPDSRLVFSSNEFNWSMFEQLFADQFMCTGLNSSLQMANRIQLLANNQLPFPTLAVAVSDEGIKITSLSLTKEPNRINVLADLIGPTTHTVSIIKFTNLDSPDMTERPALVVDQLKQNAPVGFKLYHYAKVGTPQKPEVVSGAKSWTVSVDGDTTTLNIYSFSENKADTKELASISKLFARGTVTK